MVIIKELDSEALKLSSEAIGTEWIDEVDSVEGGFDVTLAERVKVTFQFGTLNITSGSLETAFDELDFKEVIIQ